MSTKIHSHWEFVVTPGGDLFAYGDKLMEALIAQEDCRDEFTDSAVSVDSGRRILEVEANASGSSVEEALAIAQSCVRAAVHEVGIGTPEWPTVPETLQMTPRNYETRELV